MSKSYCLGIECTAHTFGVAILSLDKKPKFLANERDLFTTEKGGLIPNEVGKHHKEVSKKIYSQALEKAKITEDQIKFIALSNAPGLAPCLLEGMNFARALAEKLNVEIVPVNHCIAHLEIAKAFYKELKDPVLLYTSGANTQIIAYEAGKYRIFGETLDIGVGNFIDTFARNAGLGFPGGPKIEKLAKKGKKLIELPYSIKGMDIAFSGISTKLKTILEKKEETIEDLSFSLQETVFAMLVESAERALAHTGKKELVLGGGVACNQRLQEMCKKMCEQRGAKFFCPEKEFLVDNAAMIAYIGIKMFNAGISFKPERIDFDPRQRTDQVDVKWD